MPTTTLPYRYTHASTESMTGYFSCEPPEDLCFEDALARLEAAPLDEFLHRHLLRRIAALPPDEAADIIKGRLLGYSEEDINHFLIHQKRNSFGIAGFNFFATDV